MKAILVGPPHGPGEERGGWTVTGLASVLGMAAPTLLRHLGDLASAGVVERRPVPSSREIQYFPRPFFQAVWVDPKSGMMTQWTSPTGISWSFPLVSRVPDAKAQRTLLSFLPYLLGEGLLEPQDGRGRTHAGGKLPSLAVYGSCARGDAREDSDIDLLVWTQNTTKAYRKRFRDAVARFNLKAERSIQVRFLTFREFLDMPPEFRRSYSKDALTVFVQPGTEDFPEGVHLEVLAATVDEASQRPTG